MKPKTRKPRGKEYLCVRCEKIHKPTIEATNYGYHREYAEGTERADAIRRLRKWIKPGDKVYTVLRRRSASGMTRHISLLGVDSNGEPDSTGISDYTWNAAKALDYNMNRETGGLVIGGCGMDMGFHVVYNLGRVLYQDIGFRCIGSKRRCPSNAHSNGEGYKRQKHNDAGYCLRQVWL